MKKRYIYTLLFGIPGFLIALIISFGMLGAVTGILWVFVFGDNPWPAFTDGMLTGLFVFTLLLAWVTSMVIGFRVGIKLEKDPRLNQKHVLISTGLTVALIALIVIQQWNVGNLGPKADTVLCSDFCAQKGYAGSGMPPQNSGDSTCSCYDNFGNEALQVPLEDIVPDASK